MVGGLGWKDVCVALGEGIASHARRGRLGELLLSCVFLLAWCLLGALFVVLGMMQRTVVAAQKVSRAVAKAAHPPVRRPVAFRNPPRPWSPAPGGAARPPGGLSREQIMRIHAAHGPRGPVWGRRS
jgi:hypothetical protein